jgi:hypothetical protein
MNQTVDSSLRNELNSRFRYTLEKARAGDPAEAVRPDEDQTLELITDLPLGFIATRIAADKEWNKRPTDDGR